MVSLLFEGGGTVEAPGRHTDLDGGVVGSCSQDVIVKLKACDAVGVAFKRFDGASPVLPIVPDLEEWLALSEKIRK
jgi:hypothetical protein